MENTKTIAIEIEKEIQIPVVIKTQKLIEVPDYSNVVKMINEQNKKSEEVCQAATTYIKVAGESMIEQIKEYLKALLTPLWNIDNIEKCFNNCGQVLFDENGYDPAGYFQYAKHEKNFYVSLHSICFIISKDGIKLNENSKVDTVCLARVARSWPCLKKGIVRHIDYTVKHYRDGEKKKEQYEIEHVNIIANFEL